MSPEGCSDSCYFHHPLSTSYSPRVFFHQPLSEGGLFLPLFIDSVGFTVVYVGFNQSVKEINHSLVYSTEELCIDWLWCINTLRCSQSNFFAHCQSFGAITGTTSITTHPWALETVSKVSTCHFLAQLNLCLFLLDSSAN